MLKISFIFGLLSVFAIDSSNIVISMDKSSEATAKLAVERFIETFYSGSHGAEIPESVFGYLQSAVDNYKEHEGNGYHNEFKLKLRLHIGQENLNIDILSDSLKKLLGDVGIEIRIDQKDDIGKYIEIIGKKPDVVKPFLQLLLQSLKENKFNVQRSGYEYSNKKLLNKIDINRAAPIAEDRKIRSAASGFVRSLQLCNSSSQYCSTNTKPCAKRLQSALDNYNSSSNADFVISLSEHIIPGEYGKHEKIKNIDEKIKLTNQILAGCNVSLEYSEDKDRGALVTVKGSPDAKKAFISAVIAKLNKIANKN